MSLSRPPPRLRLRQKLEIKWKKVKSMTMVKMAPSKRNLTGRRGRRVADISHAHAQTRSRSHVLPGATTTIANRAASQSTTEETATGPTIAKISMEEMPIANLEARTTEVETTMEADASERRGVSTPRGLSLALTQKPNRALKISRRK